MRPFRLAVQTFITWKNDLGFDDIDDVTPIRDGP